MSNHHELDTEEVALSEPIRQGDILELRTKLFQQTNAFGFVLTADCDLFQNKSDNFISYLPILTARDYLENFWARREINAKINELCLRINAIYIASSSAQNESSQPLSEDTLLDMASRLSVKEFIERLRITEIKNSKEIEPVVHALKILRCYRSSSPIRILLSAQESLNVSEKALRGNLKSALRQLRNDTASLLTLPGHSERNYVVLLRYVSALPADLIFHSVAGARQEAGARMHGVRIGRAQERYKISIVQQFSSVFSRIGLPEGYHDSRRSSADDIAEAVFCNYKEEVHGDRIVD